jgi:signal transduction histidine kinase
MSEKSKKICSNSIKKSESSFRLENEILSVISHELLTPINAIAGWTKILQDDELNEQTKKKALLTIEKQIRSHTQLVDKLIDFSKMSSDNIELKKEPITISRLLRKAVKETREIAGEKNIEVSEDISIGDEICLCEEATMYKALMNLLCNAVKFTPEGGRIEIKANKQKYRIKIVIKDNGRGVEKEFQPYIFDKFRQADSSTTRKYRGLGLGLAISRKILNLHDGSIKAKSEGKGKGTEFIVKLPYDFNSNGA